MKILLISIFALCVTNAYCADIIIGGSQYTYTANSVYPIADSKAEGGQYLKCTNNITGVSCNSAGVKISYSAKTGGSGANERDPFVLTNCTFVSCACDSGTYLSGNTCKSCDNDKLATDPKSGRNFHTNTSCNYCGLGAEMRSVAQNVTACVCTTGAWCQKDNEELMCQRGYYVDGTKCTACPCVTVPSGGGSTQNCGTTASQGANKKTDCFLSPYSPFSDDTGSGQYTGTCYYTE